MAICGVTSSSLSSTVTAASRSTFRWDRILGRRLWEQTDRLPHSLKWLLDCLELLDVDDAPVVANDTAAVCSCCRWPGIMRRSGE
jgi:hypothetical protein